MKKEISAYSDAELVEMMEGRKSESDAAFGEIYKRYSSKIFTYCRYMLNGQDYAEDIFQEVFIRFYRFADKSRKNFNVQGYLYRIARNLCYNFTRDKKKSTPIIGNELITNPDKAYEKDELLGLIKTSVELLDKKYREAFVMREIDGLQYKEISEALGLSVSGAKSRVARAKEKLLEILDPYLKEISN